MDLTESANAVTPVLAREYLTFTLGQEEFGIDILKVQEIRGYDPPTRIAYAPHFVKGVVNLRGVLVPVIDLRLKLGCRQALIDRFTVVIVLRLEARLVGIVVDSVNDVMVPPPEALRPPPEAEGAIDSAAIVGLTAVGNRMLILLDIEQFMAGPDMGLAAVPNLAGPDRV